MDKAYAVDIKQTKSRCRGLKKTDREGGEGVYLGRIFCVNRWWAIVHWDGDEDPDLNKLETIEVAVAKWERMPPPVDL